MENTDFINARGSEYQHIKGWGVDADPKNNPTYPMKKRSNEEHEGYTWDRPEQQTENIELLKSNERPNVTAVFGTSIPPSGLSGKLRRYAFKYSESSYGHWLPLMLADRINVFEGIVDDFKRGHIPNLFVERGWTAEWKYNRQGFVKNAALGIIVTSALLAGASLYFQSKKRHSLT
jgi:hypothetical protein